MKISGLIHIENVIVYSDSGKSTTLTATTLNEPISMPSTGEEPTGNQGHRPAAFETLHVHIWPALLVFAAMAFWAAWATWIARSSEGT